MGRLAQICGEVLGEDTLRVAAQVHASLRHYRCAAAPQGGGCTSGSCLAVSRPRTDSIAVPLSPRRSFEDGGGADGGAAAHAVDLSDATLEALRDKISALHVTKVRAPGGGGSCVRGAAHAALGTTHRGECGRAALHGGGAQAEREAQLQQLEDVLVSLWESQHVPEEAPERSTFTSAMTGPGRLHAASLDKVRLPL